MNSKFKFVIFSGLLVKGFPLIAGPICQTDQLISEIFVNGSKWELCWEPNNKEGIILKDIFFTTPDGLERKVLKEASLAQIHVSFDDGSHRAYHLNEYGLGADNMQDLVSTQCPNGQLLKDGAKNVLCKQINQRGYLYKDYGNQKQGHLLDLYSQSNTDGYSWIVRWKFFDDGSIEPQIGVTGALQRFGTETNYGDEVGDTNEVAIASAINYFWRLDFDIAENGNNDAVEEFTVSPIDNGSKKSLSISRLTTETGRTINQGLKRSWRILDTSVTNTDGHSVSYHLEPLHAGYTYIGRTDENWAHNDIYITQFNSCERFVSNNPTIGGCDGDLTGFINGQNINGADIVVWYGLSYHHFPRDEDIPYMPTRWDSFLLLPRDWTATSPML